LLCKLRRCSSCEEDTAVRKRVLPGHFVNKVISFGSYDLGSAAFARVQVGVGVKFCQCMQESIEQIGERINRHWFV
jgi:hypothetical protein